MVKAIDSSLPSVSPAHLSRNTLILIAIAAITAVIVVGRSLVGRAQILPSPKELYDQGMELMKKQKHTEAILKFNSAIENTLDSQLKAQIYFDRAMAFLKEGDLQWALKDFDNAVDCQPLDKTLRFNIYYQRAEARKRGDDHHFQIGSSGILEDYKAALALASSDNQELELNHKIGRLYLEYDPKKASRYFTAALGCNPSEEEKVVILRDRASGFQTAKQFKEALVDLEAIDINLLKEEEKNAHRLSKGLVCLGLGEFVKAFAAFSEMMASAVSDEDKAAINYHLGLVKERKSYNAQESADRHSIADEAIKYLTEALSSANDDHLKLSIFLLRGQLRYRIGQLSDAKKDYSRAYDISRQSEKNRNSTSQILLERGKICLDLKEDNAAASDFAYGIAQAYEGWVKARFYYYLGILAEKRTQMDLARVYWNKALKCGLSDVRLTTDTLSRLGLMTK